MNPTKRFVLRRGGYVEQPPDLEYRPTSTTLAQAVERELDAKAWAAGAVHGDFELTVDGEKTVDTLERESIETLAALGHPAPFGQGEHTVYDESVRRCTQIEGGRVQASGAGWRGACDAIRAALATEMGLAGCDIEIEVHKLLLYDVSGHFDSHADTEKSEGMIASAVVVAESDHAGGALVMAHREAEARLIDGQAPRGYVQWAVWYADVAHRVEPVRSGHRVALALNVRLGASRPLEARPIRDRRLDESLWTRTFEDHHTMWARRAGLRGTGARQYARKLVWLLGHRYTEPGLKAELLKGADRQLAALLGAGRGSERALLGWIEIRTVGDARTVQGWCWSDDDSGWDGGGTARESLERQEEEEDRAGLDLHREDEYQDDDYRMRRVDPPANLPVLEMGPASRRDIWVEGLRSLDGERADYGRIAVETCELAPAEAVKGLETCGARVYEATGNEGATLELQYRHAALVVWQPNESALDMLADCGGRTALAGEFATVRRLNRNDCAYATSLSDVAERWSRAMAADGGHPAPEAHRTLLAALREGEEKTYAHEIATIDLDEAGARIVARELRATVGRERTDRREMLHQFVDGPARRRYERTHEPQWRGGGAQAPAHRRRRTRDRRADVQLRGSRGGRGADGVAEARRAPQNVRIGGVNARMTRDYPGDGLPVESEDERT